MMVRCGACRTQFEVPGPGRFACPNCGSVNVVRDAAGGAPSEMGGYPTAPGAGRPASRRHLHRPRRPFPASSAPNATSLSSSVTSSSPPAPIVGPR